MGISCKNASPEAERPQERPGRNGGPMKRGRRHGRLPHSRARAVAGGSNVGRCPISEPPAQAADPRGVWQDCRFRDTMHAQRRTSVLERPQPARCIECHADSLSCPLTQLYIPGVPGWVQRGSRDSRGFATSHKHEK